MRFKTVAASILAMSVLVLCGCTKRTQTTANTVYDTGFRFLSAGNKRLTEWGGVPEDYEEYKGTYISTYYYVFHHDGTVSFDATYLFELNPGEGFYEEHEVGTYKSKYLGPNQTISISLPSREAVWTWEPNPRDPTGGLVFRTWEKRVMTLGEVGEGKPKKEEATIYLMFYSENLSPFPL